ncbi:MAG: hypothetical protein JWQ35_570 [Bacteriovoracaceae bacterium]|nr:hypothetical protein [Bacteriovoracaceae bacterium]
MVTGKKSPILLFSFFLISSGVEAYDCQAHLLGLARANEDVAQFGGLNPINPVTKIANWMLNLVPRRDVQQIQMAVPVSLFYNEYQAQQFGDGVQNSSLSFSPSSSPPFVSILVRNINPSNPANLALMLSKDFPGLRDVKALEFSISGERKIVSLDPNGFVQINVDPEKLHWNRLLSADPIFFRPIGWNDWFLVQFPQAYVSIADLVNGMAARYRSLPSGQSIVDPLGLKGSVDPETALQQIPDSRNLGFAFAGAEPRVHGVYIDESGHENLTATGTATTRYRLPHIPDFAKIIYLKQKERNLISEKAEGLVSGTGPHRIGSPATAEIILNPLGDEPLMTFHGIALPDLGPNGEGLAWHSALPNLYIGTWLANGMAFVAPQGTYHQHLTHTIDRPVFVQVLTPPEIPSAQNQFGFPGH